LRGLCQRDRKLGALARDGGPGNRYENIERRSQCLLPIDAASDDNRKGSGELDRAAGDLLVEYVAFGGRLAADDQEPVTLLGLGTDYVFARLLDTCGDFGWIARGSLGTGVVAFHCTLLDDSLGTFGLPGSLMRWAGGCIVEMNNRRRNAPGPG